MKKLIKYYLNNYFSSLYSFLLLIKFTLNYFSSSKRRCSACLKLSRLQIPGYCNTFFGYFDKSPFNPYNNNLMAFHANNAKPWRKPDASIPTSIVLYDIKNNKVIKEISKTNAWNWQQGARLFWLNKNKLIYNKFDDEAKIYFSEIYNIKENTYKKIPIPVQDAFNDNYLISISYQVLHKTRPDYGYRNLFSQPDLYQAKLTCFDLVKEDMKILSSVEELIKLTRFKDQINKISYPRINHVSIAPDGLSFIFLLRFYYQFDLQHFLFYYDFQEDNFKILMQQDMISHYTWLEKNKILMWAVIDGNGDYYIYESDNGSLRYLNTGLSDGHPTKISDRKFITDTYPGKNRYRKLLLNDLESKKIDELAAFFEPLRFLGECRCDLHPHYYKQSGRIHVDTIKDSYRCLTILDLENENDA